MQELEEGEVVLQKGTKQQKMAKDLRDKRSTSVDSQEELNGAEVRLQHRTWSPRLEVDGATALGTPLLRSSRESFCLYN